MRFHESRRDEDPPPPSVDVHLGPLSSLEVEPVERRSKGLDMAAGFLLLVSDVLPLVLVLAVAVYAFLLDASAETIGRSPLDLAPIVLIAITSGLFSCSLLEAAKRLLRLRGLYQQRQIRLWISATAGSHRLGKASIAELLRFTGVLSDNELARIRHTGRRSVGNLLEGLLLFDLPIEQLTAQMSEAVEAALQTPDKYPALYRTMVRPTREKDEHRGVTDNGVNLQTAMQARLSMDRLQISVGNRWRRYVSGAALGLSGLIGLYLWHAMSAQSNFFLVGLVSTFAGGFFAWFLRDLAAGVERWRRDIG